MPVSVSVILTFYNNVDYVDAALRQVDALENQDFELLVTDDGSTDGTRQLLVERISARPRTRFLAADSNLGIAMIRNWAVEEASGEFVWFLDCDDIWDRRALVTLRRIQQESGADIAMCHAVRVHDRSSEEGKLLDSARVGVYEDRELVRLMLVGGIRGYLWNKLIRRELLLQHPFPPRAAQEDFAAISQIVLSGARLVCSEDVLYRHVERMGSITNSAICSYTDLEETCAAVVSAVAEGPFASELRREVSSFEQRYLISSVVNTSIRLGLADRSLRHYVRQIRRRVTWRRVFDTWTLSRREGLIAFAIKVLGPAYPLLYRSFLRGQSSGKMSRATGQRVTV